MRGIHDPLYAGSRFLNRQAEWVCHVNPDRLPRFSPVERQRGRRRGKPVRIDYAENHVGVGYGRAFPAAAVTGGSRFRTTRLSGPT